MHAPGRSSGASTSVHPGASPARQRQINGPRLQSPGFSSITHGTKYRYRAPREVSAELFCLQRESLGPGEKERVMEGTK